MSVPTITPAALHRVREGFKQRGETQIGFCRQHGFSYHNFQMVLQGRVKGDRGEGHKILVALGLKKEAKHG